MSQKNATIAVINNNKILLLKRGYSAPWMPNKYCLVGGGVDDNESLVDAAIREAKEEIGLTIDRKELQNITVNYSDNYSKVVFVLISHEFCVTLNYEHSEYTWCDFDSCFNLYNQKLLVPRLLTVVKKLNKDGLLL